MFKDEYHPQVKKDLKALEKSVIKDIKEKHIFNIINNPNWQSAKEHKNIDKVNPLP